MKSTYFGAAFGVLVLLQASGLAAQETLPREIGVRDMGAGRLFVNQDGLTLYTFKQDREQPGTSVCVDECAKMWPPVAAPADATPLGDWTTVQRPDESLQWAYKGQPVYIYVKDTHPGAIVGEKASGFWDVLYEPMDMPPDIVLEASVLGQILTDLDGHTIYTQAGGACDATCMKPWRPVEAPWLAGPIGEKWTITRHSDGLAQWVFEDKPLYTYTGDFRPGDVHGQDAEGEWDVVVLQDAPAIPSWVTFQETDIGPVIADQNRMTLYYLVNDPEQIRRETCDDQCVKDNFTRVFAGDTDQSVDNWSTMELEDGSRQWTYLGYPVFLFHGDKMPGDIYGDKFGTGSEIRGGWNAILKETLIQKLASS